MQSLFIGCDDSSLEPVMLLWVQRYGFEINQHALPRLQVTSTGLVLLSPLFSPLSVDFLGQSLQQRKLDAKKQGLVRACKPSPGVTIVDATAGWGRDSALLASLGAHVIMVERYSMMAALLDDGLNKLKSAESNPVSLSLVYRDANDYLQALEPKDYPDVIYIDPMHPTRQKSALVKKDMQILQQLLGPDDAVNDLLDMAQQRARQRVVIKWPQHAKELKKPSMSIPGKTVRFDVFLC